MIGESVQSSSSSAQRPLQGNYCAVVASNACECGTPRKVSHEDAHTVYTQIDPVATVAATQVFLQHFLALVIVLENSVVLCVLRNLRITVMNKVDS